MSSEGGVAYRLVPYGVISSFCKAVFASYGFVKEEAAQITDVLLQADLFGIESHGISRLIKYHRFIQDGVVQPNATPERVYETAVSAVYDAHSAIGQVMGVRAMSEAIDKAAEHGVGLVEVRGANHYGIAGYYALMAARHDMLGISMTNTVAILVPTFAAEAVLGSNPIALAMPTGGDPFLYDGATSVATRGKLEVCNKRGVSLGEGWAVSEKGLPESDAQRVLTCIKDRIGGGLLPVGGIGEEQAGYKGYGFATICEILTSVLAGGVSSAQKRDVGDTSQCFWAIDYGIFGDKAAIRARLVALIRELHEARKAAGHERVFVAGEKEFESERARRALGIPINDKTLGEIERIGLERGVTIPDFER